MEDNGFVKYRKGDPAKPGKYFRIVHNPVAGAMTYYFEFPFFHYRNN
jgi:hypothetical protein